MRVITWNCAQAFRRKQRELHRLDPDIAVVPECENPSEKGDWSAFSDWRWTGNNLNKGLGVFTRNGISIQTTTEIPTADHFLHIETDKVSVFAVWAMNNTENPRQRYIGQVHTALREYPDLVDENTIVAGDFNWNVIWDESPNSSLCGDFADTREIFRRSGLRSVYHEVCNEEFGDESDPTFYMHKQKGRPYHIDYIFVPERMIGSDTGVTVGDYSDWIDVSDHIPVLVDVEL